MSNISYAGMTVNERLVVSGLIDQFDKARKSKDRNKIIEILRKVGLDERSIAGILKDFNM
jgi:hypothetical protein